MFFGELIPIFKELTQQPVAFMSGFVSGVLRLNLAEEPLKAWLEKQGISNLEIDNNGKNQGNGPQSISID